MDIDTDKLNAFMEPFANDRLQDNLNPVGRVYDAASTMMSWFRTGTEHGTRSKAEICK